MTPGSHARVAHPRLTFRCPMSRSRFGIHCSGYGYGYGYGYGFIPPAPVPDLGTVQETFVRAITPSVAHTLPSPSVHLSVRAPTPIPIPYEITSAENQQFNDTERASCDSHVVTLLARARILIHIRVTCHTVSRLQCRCKTGPTLIHPGPRSGRMEQSSAQSVLRASYRRACQVEQSHLPPLVLERANQAGPVHCKSPSRRYPLPRQHLGHPSISRNKETLSNE